VPAEYQWRVLLYGILGVIVLHASIILAGALLRFASKHLRSSKALQRDRFKVLQDGVTYFTPLFLVLLLIEFSVVIFAVDSIPAIFAITTDTFIVFTSNIFAILGLRALYFLLLGIVGRFHF
jgi:tellurite resistance protein TerC